MTLTINNFQVNKESHDNESHHKFVKSNETETVVLHTEAERRKPLTSSEKRRRNETLAIGLSKTDLLNTHNKDNVNEKEEENITEVRIDAASDSFDTKSSKVDNIVENDQSVSKSSVTNDITEKEKESIGSTNIINNSIDHQNSDKTDSIQHGLNEKTESCDEKEHETKIQDDMKENPKKMSSERAEKEDNSYFKEVVSGVIKSLAQNNSTESKEICEETHPQPPFQEKIMKEKTEICQVIKDHDKDKDEVLTNIVNQNEFQKSENANLTEDILQNDINIDKKNNLEEKTQEYVTIERIENLENASLGEGKLQNNIKMDEEDKQEDTSQEHSLKNVAKTEIADIENEKVLENNMKINDQIKEEEKINNMPQTSSIEENINTDGEISNNDENLLEQIDENTVFNLENIEPGQNVEKGEETTTEIKTDVPETEKLDITVKVNIQTISLGSVSEQEILEYNENGDIEKSECDEEVDEE